MKAHLIESLRPFALLCTALRAFLLIAAFAGPVTAQDSLFSSEAPLDPRAAFALSVSPQPDGSRLLRWKIADGYYLYRDYLSVETASGVSIPLESEPGKQKNDPTFGTVEVYYDEASARISPVSGALSITYQGCQEDGICYPPITDSLPALPASAATEAEEQASAPTAGITLADDSGLVDGLVRRGGLGLLLLGFFGFGLLLAFTPCVLPMIPILGGLLAGQGESLTARRGLALSAAYVFAMSSALALLGVAAAWSGQNLQIVLQSPWAVGAVALLFVALAMSMFGVFQLRLPQAWNDRMAAAGIGRRGTFAGAAGLGFTSALIMGPCVTAPLAGALLYIAQTGDTALGAAALFSLGLGQGVPLLLLGAFGSRALPRAGRWMRLVNRLFGFIFLAMAAWLAGRVVPPAAGLAIWAGALVLTGVFLGALDRQDADAAPIQRLRQAAGMLALLAGGLMGIGAASGGDDPLRPLARLTGGSQNVVSDKAIDFTTIRSVPELEAALAQSDRPAMIYFTAEWCVSCRTIERRVWPDAEVQAALSEMQVIAADLTTFDAESQGLLDHLRSVGPPTMVFLDAEGQERKGTRLIGEPRPAEVVASARAVQ